MRFVQRLFTANVSCFLALLIFAPALLPAPVAAQSAPKLQGEWKVTYLRYTAPGEDWTVDTPAPVLAIFGKNRYSANGVPEPGRPDNLLPFLGTAGTYKTEGAKLILHPEITRGAAVAAGETTYTAALREVNGNLFATFTEGDASLTVRMTKLD